MSRKTGNKLGFSLIELMIVVAIISILVTIALPTYRTIQMEGRRDEAFIAVTSLQGIIERYLIENNQNTLQAADLNAGALFNEYAAGRDTKSGYYRITVTTTGSVGTGGYTITATAQDIQADDLECATISLSQDGTKSSTSSNNCW